MADPVNPAHYAGRACADIGEHLTANSYQVLKYNWRLGKKDSALIEIDKSLWYLESELALHRTWDIRLPGDNGSVFPTDEWFVNRLCGQSDYVRAVALSLINWCRYGDQETLIYLRGDILSRRAELEHA